MSQNLLDISISNLNSPMDGVVDRLLGGTKKQEIIY
jgi:hypothetical protein